MLSRGLTGTVACPGGRCAVQVVASVDPRTLKKLGLRAAGTAVFRGTSVTADGKTRIVLRPSSAAKRRLKKMRSIKLTIGIHAAARMGA